MHFQKNIFSTTRLSTTTFFLTLQLFVGSSFFQSSIAQTVLPYKNEIDSTIINENSDNEPYQNINTIEPDSDPLEHDYLIAIHKYIIDNEEWSEQVCKKLQIDKPELYEKCMKICILDCYCSLLYHILFQKDNPKINNKAKHETISHWQHMISENKTYLPGSIITHPEVIKILDIYFQSLFSDEKKQELWIYYEINLFSDLPIMTHISFEQIKKAYDDEKINHKNQIITELEFAFTFTGIDIDSWFDRNTLIDRKFQDLKDEYYRLKIEDEAKRLVDEMSVISAYTHSCPQCIGLDDYELLQDKIKYIPHQQYFSDYLLLSINDISQWNDSSFNAKDYLYNNLATYLRNTYWFILVKDLEYNLKYGSDLRWAWIVLHDIQKLNQRLWYEEFSDQTTNFAYKIRQNTLRNDIYSIFRKLHFKQEQWNLTISTSPTKEEIIQLVIKELELHENIRHYKRFFTKYLMFIDNSDRNNELVFFITSEFKMILDDVACNWLFPELPDLERD